MNIRLPQGLVDQHTQFTFRRKNLTAQDIIFGKTCHKNFPLRNSFPVIGDVDITRKKSWKSMPVSMDTAISNSMLMMASQVRPSTAQAFSR